MSIIFTIPDFGFGEIEALALLFDMMEIDDEDPIAPVPLVRQVGMYYQTEGPTLERQLTGVGLDGRSY